MLVIIGGGGWSILHVAARNEMLASTEFLLKKGANVNARADNGWTPLYVAVRERKFTGVSKLLLDSGADVNVSGYWSGNSLLHEALAIPKSLELVVLLVKRGADAFSRDKNNETAFDIAKKSRRQEEGVLDVLKDHQQLQQLQHNDLFGLCVSVLFRQDAVTEEEPNKVSWQALISLYPNKLVKKVRFLI